MPHSEDRYIAFAEAYLNPDADTFYNIYQSMRSAGYSHHYSKNKGVKQLEVRQIKEALQKKQAELKSYSHIATPAEIIQLLTKILFFNPKRLTKDEKCLKLHELDNDTARMITGIEINKSTTKKGVQHEKIKYKWESKRLTAETLGRLLGLTNGNSNIIRDLLEQVGLLQINIQNNQYNLMDNTSLEKAIEHKDG